MNSSYLKIAQKLHANMKLDNSLYPVSRFGNTSKFGFIFETRNGKIMKISPAGANANREANIARAAGNAGVGPKIHDVRTTHSNLSQELFRGANGLQIVIMNKVKGAKSFYNSVKNKEPVNLRMVKNAIAKMHAAKIHHGNLHGKNILVEYDDTGKPTRVWIIDFGASTISNKVKNLKTTEKLLLEGPYKMAPPTHNRSYAVFSENGRKQLIVPNSVRWDHLMNFAFQSRTRP